MHPGEFPGGGDRTRWLAGLTGVDEHALASSWEAFEPVLESGRAETVPPLGPELTWLTQVAEELGSPITPEILDLVERDWDLTRRAALLDPPAETVAMLGSLHSGGLKIGVLSNTHAMEMRAWPDSPLAGLVDGVVLSHEIGVMKPERAAYAAILDRLGVQADAAAYVGDGSSNELVGARRAGFALVILAAEAPRRLLPARLPVLAAQADLVLDILGELPAVLKVSLGSVQD